MFHYQCVEPSEIIAIREEILEWLAKELDTIFPNETNGILNIAFLDDESIRVLNRDHRGINKTTDVLSFHYHEDFSELSEEDTAGEIILSESRIQSQAEEYHETLEAETCKLIIHSSLHILGFDHENDEDYEEMRPLEKDLEERLYGAFGIRIQE